MAMGTHARAYHTLGKCNSWENVAVWTNVAVTNVAVTNVAVANVAVTKIRIRT